ncbi:hypothetical protein Tco_0413950 [Tanacetum coccineum]
MSSYYQPTCYGCGGLLDSSVCQRCNPNFFDNSQYFSDYPPQPQYETYNCRLCGNEAHFGYDCPPQVPFDYNPDPCYDHNFDYFPQTAQESQSQFSVTHQDISLDIARIIKANRALFDKNIFPYDETSMRVLLAKERILKIIQDWDEKQIESWNFPEVLRQLTNDSQTIAEMLKEQREKQIEEEKRIEHKQEEQAKEDLMDSIQSFLKKFSRIPFGETLKIFRAYLGPLIPV